MITQYTKYNPVYHSNIPSNFRFWHKTEKRNEPLPDNDEVIFNMWRDLYQCDDGEAPFGLYELMLDACIEYSETGTYSV
jgi:hypothetical protein